MFSRRVPADLTLNRLTSTVRDLQRAGRPIVDLTESNPTKARFEYPSDLLQPLADPRALTYAPGPFGSREAREAVSADYARRHVPVPADRIILTSSTSEAYSLLFKVLCDEGDSVVIPRPSYPLFEHLTRLDSVVARHYELDYHGRWEIDLRESRGAAHRADARRARGDAEQPDGLVRETVRSSQRSADCAPIAASRSSPMRCSPITSWRREAVGTPPRSCRATTGSFSAWAGSRNRLAFLRSNSDGWRSPVPSRRSGGRRPSRTRLRHLLVGVYSGSSCGRTAARARRWRAGSDSGRVAANYRWLQAQAETGACRVLHAEGGWYAVLQVPTLWVRRGSRR